MRSPRRLLYAKENRFRLVNRCLYERYFIAGINLVARRCTASNLCMCFFKMWGPDNSVFQNWPNQCTIQVKKHITHVAKAFSY